MVLDTQLASGRAPSQADPSQPTDAGRVPAVVTSQGGQGEDPARKVRQDEKYRKELRATTKELEQLRAEKQARIDAEAVAQGKIGELHKQEQVRAAQLAAQLVDRSIEVALLRRKDMRELSALQVEDILRALDRTAIEHDGAAVHGLDEQLEAMRKQRPYLFAVVDAAPASGAAPPVQGDPGLESSRPGRVVKTTRPITPEIRRQAALRNMEPADWVEILDARDADAARRGARK